MENQNLKLKEAALSFGADLFGAADVKSARKYFLIEPKEILSDLDYALSIGVRLSDKVIDSLVNEPTMLYSMHYRRVNYLLDEVVTRLTGLLQKMGYAALPIPASQVIDFKNQLAHVDHRVVANLAGLGWLGRCGLLVNPEFGARVRYATLLTNAPLEASKPNAGSCGECKSCLEICPSNAIREKKEDFVRENCTALLKDFSKKPGINQMICGLCVKACKPQGRLASACAPRSHSACAKSQLSPQPPQGD